ncbi:MAG: Hsp20/alpha crystallin family protein [Candidatus Dadabacteria bacterium]|nr:MAG: Hsp20/alpha crystallin family protein [Candidatus Dadabacteria bacterium]
MARDWFWLSCRHEIDRLFDTLVHTAWGQAPGAAPAWSPAVDVVEEDDRYRIEMDLPGVETNDLNITAEPGALRIEGVRRRRLPGGGTRQHLSERPAGPFRRSFRLPSDADPNTVRARLRDGVLVVEIGKRG